MSKLDTLESRRELELELERLTQELTNVRVLKSKQRQRIEQLQQEQLKLKDQLDDNDDDDAQDNISNNEQQRSGLKQQLTSLTQVVKQKKVEHWKVKQEWERSQEEYHQLKRTVGLLQRTNGDDGEYDETSDASNRHDDDSLEDDLNNIPPAASTQSKDFLQSMWGSMKSNPQTSFRSTFAEGLADEAASPNFFNASFDPTPFHASFSKEFETMPDSPLESQDAFLFHQDEEAEAEAALLDDGECDGIDDGGTVITEHTKDSLQVYRKSKDESMRTMGNSTSRRSNRSNGTGSNSGGLGNFFDKEKARGSNGSMTYTSKIKGGDDIDKADIE